MCLKKILFFIFVFAFFFINFQFVSGESNEDGVNIKQLDDRNFFKKCIEYRKLCSSELLPLHASGERAASKEFPYMALVGDDKKDSPNEFVWFCSGSLISENFVLTAGHCVLNSVKSAKYVRLGDLDYKNDDDTEGSQFTVTETFAHSSYNEREFYNDIALLRLEKNVKFNENIQPACLPHPNAVLSEKLLVIGWGRTSSNQESHSSLQKIPLNLVPIQECVEYYKPARRLLQGINNQIQFCAGPKIGERDACAGFGGGPLIDLEQNSSCLHEIAGTVSFGNGCGNGFPGVYTRVSSYVDWIESIVWPL